MPKKSNDKGQAGKSQPGSSTSRRRQELISWVILAVVAGLVAGFFLGRHMPAPPAPPVSPSVHNATEAKPAHSLAQRSDLVDQALHRAWKSQHADAPALRQQVAEQREHEGQQYAYRAYRLPAEPELKVDAKALYDELSKELAHAAPFAALNKTSADIWDIHVDGLPVLRLRLTPEGAEAPKPEPAGKGGKARLAIVIDDMGEDVAIAKQLAALGQPIAFSIWPDSSHRETVLKIAKEAGREILIHLPMQPKGYPQVKPGPHVLLLSMTPEQLRAEVDRAVSRVHGAIGVNNHMGSAYTESSPGMRLALSELQSKGLFFLDSRTSAATVGVAEAKHLGLRVYERDVFLDNEQSAPEILKQLKLAEKKALKLGQAIAIGHPHKETVAAIRQWLREKDPSVQLSTVSSLSPR